eukprot:3939789-Rhodomonas_salina.1
MTGTRAGLFIQLPLNGPLTEMSSASHHQTLPGEVAPLQVALCVSLLPGHAVMMLVDLNACCVLARSRLTLRAEADGDPALGSTAGIKQSVTLTKGISYQLLFYAHHRNMAGQEDTTLQANVEGVTVFGPQTLTGTFVQYTATFQ